MAKIVRRPELRYTQDNQTPYAQMLVEFSANRAEATPTNLRAVAWGNLASEVAQNYNEGDQVIFKVVSPCRRSIVPKVLRKNGPN